MNIDKIIESNSKLIYKIASKFYGVDIDDLYQSGVVGLLKAYKNYQENGQTKFSTYAYEYIYGEMYLLAHSKTLKINKDILKLYRVIEKTRFALAQKYNRIPTSKEIALFLELPEEKIDEAVLAGKEIMSLDMEEQGPVYEMIEAKENTNIDEKILINESLSVLSDDEKEIIKARYYEDLTQSEVARKLKMTQVMVSRYEKKSLNKMSSFINL